MARARARTWLGQDLAHLLHPVDPVFGETYALLESCNRSCQQIELSECVCVRTRAYACGEWGEMV